MNAYILTILLLNPAGQVQPPVSHEHPTRLSCEVERLALYRGKVDMKGWKLRSAECVAVKQGEKQ